ncbi:hypothetical protein AGOR_G00024270, partial [Albula goreensis]
PPPPQPTTQDPPPPTSQAPLPSSPTTQGPPSPTAQAPPPSPPTTQDPPLSTTGVPLPPSTQDPPQPTTQAPTPYTADPSLLLIKTGPTHPLLTTIHSASTTEHLSSQRPTTTPSQLSPMSNSPLTVFLSVLSTTSSPTTSTNTASPTILAPVTPNTLTEVSQSTSSTLSPNTFTSFVLPTSLAFSSTTLSTSPPPTFSTESAPTSSSPSLTTPSMSLSTITMENFENASSTSNFTLTTATSPNPTTGSLASLCSFSAYCASNSSFYWMVLDVESTHGVNESEVSTWLSNVFNIHICEQSEQSLETNTAANTTSTPMSSTVSPLDSGILKMAPSHSSASSGKKEKKCQNGNETPVSLFQGIEVSCDEKEKIRQTNCTVLLNLTSGTDPCVLHRALQVKVEGFTMQAQILGKVENVGIGLCHSGDVPPGGFYEKCSSPYPLSDDCNSEGGIMVSCNRSSNTVVIPVDPHSPVEQNCTEVIQPDPEHLCNCSTVCKEQAAYYMLTIGVTGPQITFTDIRSLIDKLGSDPPSCNSSFSNIHDLCTKIPKISKLYQEAHLECLGMGSQLNSCTVVLKMSRAVSICALRATLVSLFQTSEGIYYTNPLTRVVICDWPSGSRVNMSQVNLTWVSTEFSLQYSEICANQSSINLTCKTGETLGVPLDDICLPWPIPPVFGTAPPAHTTLNATTTVDTSTMPPTSTAQHNTTFISSSPTLPRQPNTPPLNMTRAPLYTTGSLQNVTTPSPNTVNATKGDRPTKATVSSPNTTTSNKTATAAGNSTNPVIPIKPTITATVSPTTVPTTTVDAEGQAEQLLNLTRDVSSLNSSQVAQLVNQLAALLSGPNVSLDLGRTTVTIVSNLLNASVDALAPSSNKIIGLVDTVGLKLVVKDETETILSDSVALAVKKVDGANFEETSFSITNPSSVQINNVLRAQTSSAPQGSITLPASLTNGLTPEQQLLASRVQFNFYQKGTVFQDRDLRGRRLNSGILGTTVANLSISDLTDNVVITLRNNEPVPANFVASCVFWDFSKNNGLGGWNQHGCSVQNSTDEETVCSCNHLTSFAVLLDISREGIKNRLQSIILTYITYIGCGISAIFLSITLLTYLAFGKLRKDIPSKILIQLCTALLLLNLTFLLDSWLALYPDAVGLCISTAFFLHYFLLVSFTWMGLEALHMYLAIVKVFNTYVSRYMLKFSLVGWGIPLIVVIIVIAIDKNNYGLISYGQFEDGSTDEFCWLKNNVAFYVAVVAYFCVIFLVNLIMFVVVLVQLCRIKRQNPQNAQQRNGVHELRSVAGLTVLLGLTWGFAFFAWGPVNLAFMYLFSIFNSLQGLFIFIFHCALKENVRKQWRTYLCCGKLRLPENTEWSRTATRKTVNLRRANRGTSYGSSNSLHSSNTSSSSFLASDSTERQNGVGSMYDDRQITSLEEPNGDVVLNEIHSRHRTPRGQ